MTHTKTFHRRLVRVRSVVTTVAACVVAVGVLAACDTERALSVESPSRIPAGSPENPATAFLRTSHRFTCVSRVSTVSLRSPLSAMPLRTARCSSRSYADTRGYTPKSCGR